MVLDTLAWLKTIFEGVYEKTFFFFMAVPKKRSSKRKTKLTKAKLFYAMLRWVPKAHDLRLKKQARRQTLRQAYTKAQLQNLSLKGLVKLKPVCEGFKTTS